MARFPAESLFMVTRGIAVAPDSTTTVATTVRSKFNLVNFRPLLSEFFEYAI